MSTQTPERTIADVIEDLNLDDALRDAVPPPVCEVQVKRDGPLCGKPATWLASGSCGHDSYYCAPHHDQITGRVTDGATMLCEEHDAPTEIVIAWCAL